MRLESHGHIRRRRSQSDRRRHVVSITAAGTSALEGARGLEHSVLANTAVDTDKLRNELQTIVRLLAGRAEEASRKTVKADTGSAIII